MRDSRRSHGFYRRRGKRWLDLALALPLLVLLSPILAVLACAIAAVSGRPVLFRQTRPGRGGRLFEIYKFRTMTPTESASPLGDDERLTLFGRLLRRTSLDELPELWNVVRGDLSLVGPRPLLTRYLELYSPEQARRHEVTPGITGWAQIHGRNALEWEQRLRHDVWYVDHLGLRLDLMILARTIAMVLRGRGVSAPGHETMPEFRGEGR